MADKFRKTFPIRVTFSDGEQPTGAKLNTLSEQARNALALLEKAVGDIWNQSGDSLLKDHPLQIPNLARMLGANGYLNPTLIPVANTFHFTEDLGARAQGLTGGFLVFKPDGVFGSIFGTAITGAPESSESDVDSAGKWWIDVSTGRWRSYSPLTGDEKITYSVDPDELNIGSETLPGIIPDPGQARYTGVRVSESSGKYYIHLPPRLPLTLSTQEEPFRYPGEGDELTDDNGATANGAPYKLWQSAGLGNALTDEHYRYSLPKELIEAWSGLAENARLPDGIMYLWDTSTNTLIDNVVFRKPSVGYPSYCVMVSSTTYDFSTLVSVNDNESSYNTNLILITIGTPIARAIWSLTNAFFRHRHNQRGIGDPSIDHSELDSLNPVAGSGYPSYLPPWSPSKWSQDAHTSLLSRGGSQGATNPRDKNDNAILGDLVIANSDKDIDDIFLDEDCSDNSFRLCFGATTGPGIKGISKTAIESEAGIQISVPSDGLLNTVPLKIEGESSPIPDGSTISAMVVVTGHNALSGKTDAIPGGLFTGGAGDSLKPNGAIGITGIGGDRVGAGTSGIGIKGIGGTANGIGVYGQGVGYGQGLYAIGDTVQAIYAVGGSTNYTPAIEGIGGSSNGMGVKGSGTGNGPGVFGTSATGNGVYAEGGTGSGTAAIEGKGGSNNGKGVKGIGGTSTDGIGVEGVGTGTGAGGNFTGGAASAPGVIGISPNGIGVAGVGATVGVKGHYALTGVEGIASGSSGKGVYAEGELYGLHAKQTNTGTGTKYGIYAEAVGSASIGIFSTAVSVGVWALSSASLGRGIFGNSSGSSGFGVYGEATGSSSYGVLGAGIAAGVYGTSDSGYGVVAEGKANPTVTGKSAFRIVPQSGTPATLENGAMWCVGSDLYIRLNGTTYTISKT